MRAAWLVIVGVVVAYIVWVAIPKSARKAGMKTAGPHIIRLGLILLVVGIIIAAAYYLPVSSLTF